MAMIQSKNKKGLLLTLLVIVLFVLMLGEVITYVVINVNYDSLTQQAASASAGGVSASLVSLSITSMLHTSLLAALGTLETIEGNTLARQGIIVNNTQYSLTSLMENGTIYGASFGQYMDAALISNFSNSINASLASEGVSIRLIGGNLTVFQGTPSTINASYYAVAMVNTTAGTYTYPIRATTSVQLNGTLDIVGAQQGMPSTISIQKSLPTAVLVGNSYATAGSTGKFSFAYGTVLTALQNPQSGGGPTCGSLGSFATTQNAPHYILVTSNTYYLIYDTQPCLPTGPPPDCGFAGVITDDLSVPSGGVCSSYSSVDVPYLVYPTSNAFNSLWQGANLSQVLLDGAGLAAYNTSSLQSAIQTDKYFTSPYVPSYIDQQNVFTQRQVNGLFSFGSLNWEAPNFTEFQQEGILVKSGIVLPSTFTISFWLNKGAFALDPSTGCDSLIYFGNSLHSTYFDILSVPNFAPSPCTFGGSTWNGLLDVAYTDASGTLHYTGTPSTSTNPGTWIQATVVVGHGTLSWYINGNPAGNYVINNLPVDANSLYIGGEGAIWSGFNGSLSNIQIYNTPLSAFYAQQLYREGITGLPVASANLIAWYPLNGNANDYSGHNYNGNVVGVTYNYLSGYYADPIYRNILTNSTTYAVPGALNCGSLDQCTSQQRHLYLGGYPLSYVGNVALGESSALGLGNAVLPDVLGLYNVRPGMSGGTTAYITEQNSISWLDNSANSFSMSIWAYPTVFNGVIVDENNYTASKQDSCGYTGFLHEEMVGVYNDHIYVGVYVCSTLADEQLTTTPAIYNWTQIGFTYNSISQFVTTYINGVQVAGFGAARLSLNNPIFYSLGRSDSTNFGSGPSFSGYLANFQIYNNVLSSNQMLSLYLNGSVNAGPAASPSINMPLSSYYRGFDNLTPETVAGDTGIFTTGSTAPCSLGSVMNLTCGLSIGPP